MLSLWHGGDGGLLQESKGWEELTARDSTFNSIRGEQSEELCGPKPHKPSL